MSKKQIMQTALWKALRRHANKHRWTANCGMQVDTPVPKLRHLLAA